jgi:hypothetical protein
MDPRSQVSQQTVRLKTIGPIGAYSLSTSCQALPNSYQPKQLIWYNLTILKLSINSTLNWLINGIIWDLVFH